MYVCIPYLEEFEEKVESSCGEPLATLAFVNLVRELIESGVNDHHLQVGRCLQRLRECTLDATLLSCSDQIHWAFSGVEDCAELVRHRLGAF